MLSLKYCSIFLASLFATQTYAALGIFETGPDGSSFKLLNDVVVDVEMDINFADGTPGNYVIAFPHAGVGSFFDNPSMNASGPDFVAQSGDMSFTNFAIGTSGDGVFDDFFGLVFEGAALNLVAGEQILFSSGSAWFVDDDLSSINPAAIYANSGYLLTNDGSGSGLYVAGAVTVVPEPSFYAAIFGVCGLSIVLWKGRARLRSTDRATAAG